MAEARTGVARPFQERRYLPIGKELWDIYEASKITDKHGKEVTPLQLYSLRYHLVGAGWKNNPEAGGSDWVSAYNMVIMKGPLDRKATYSLKIGKKIEKGKEWAYWKLKKH